MDNFLYNHLWQRKIMGSAFSSLYGRQQEE